MNYGIEHITQVFPLTLHQQLCLSKSNLQPFVNIQPASTCPSFTIVLHTKCSAWDFDPVACGALSPALLPLLNPPFGTTIGEYWVVGTQQIGKQRSEIGPNWWWRRL